MPGSPSTLGSSSGRPHRPPDRRQLLDQLRRLTARDRLLLSWLAEHYVLSTAQISQALFTSPRSATLRLATLRAIDAVTAFGDVTVAGRQNLYTLGPLGMIVERTTYHDPDQPQARAPRTSVERTERIAGSRNLKHLLGTNQLFIDLYAHTRTDSGARLVRWWSEQHATAAYAAASYAALTGVRPDAHGVWHAGGRTVGFFLEHDNGTEPLLRVLTKLKHYERLAEVGPRYPVLLRVPSRRREANLLDALAGIPTAMPVATGVHDDHPAAAAWTLTTDPARRRRLHELPSDHGPHNQATNPHRYTGDDDPD